MAELSVHTERRDGRLSVAVGGELDLGTVDGLEEAVAGELAGGPVAELVLDLADVTFIDSSGLGALLRIRQAALDMGSRLTIDRVGAGPARVIAIAGLSGTFGLPEH